MIRKPSKPKNRVRMKLKTQGEGEREKREGRQKSMNGIRRWCVSKQLNYNEISMRSLCTVSVCFLFLNFMIASYVRMRKEKKS
jgi:hypothetical protein